MRDMQYYLGIDVGSVSTNIVVIDDEGCVKEKLYLRTTGKPIDVLIKGLGIIFERLGKDTEIKASGATGSGRQLASAIVGTDVVKNEITAHAVAAKEVVPDVRTILEIGGQDSKIIFLRNGVAYDFAMNTVCAAGTGSFLDRQASRLEIPIEEFGDYALRSKSPVRIAGRCAVFAESDMIHKQQTGHSMEDIIGGLCVALVRNYLNNLAKGKEILEPVVFQGGVAANIGILEAFKKELNLDIVVPPYYDVMGAYGAALLARDKALEKDEKTKFFGFNKLYDDYTAQSYECKDCSNMCEIIKISANGQVVANWGDKCGKWTSIPIKLTGDVNYDDKRISS